MMKPLTAWDSRENNFDFLRLALAVLVIYSHAYPLGLGSEVREPFVRATHGQATGGGLAVDGFFIMSGFLICASAQRSRSVADFLKKRIARIYPGYVAATLVLAVVVVPLAGAGFQFAGLKRVLDFLLQALRLKDFHYTHAFVTNPFPDVLNGSLWSVSYEFWCYLGVALLSVLTLLRHRTVILGLFVLSWAIGIAFRLKGWMLGGKWVGAIVGPPHLWARLLPLYLAGMVFYLYRDRIALRWDLAALSAAAMGVGCFFYAGISAMMPIAGAYLMLWVAFGVRFGVRGVARYGDISYGTYLYAFPIEQLLMRYFGGTMAPWRLFLLATPLTLAMAAASWYAVERPFLRPARRKETVLEAG